MEISEDISLPDWTAGSNRRYLRPERTLAERVAELERKFEEHDRDIAALKRATGIK